MNQHPTLIDPGTPAGGFSCQRIITAMEPNPLFAEQLAEWNHDVKHGRGFSSQPSPETEVKKLETVLSEAEFIACRNSILGQMGQPPISIPQLSHPDPFGNFRQQQVQGGVQQGTSASNIYPIGQ